MYAFYGINLISQTTTMKVIFVESVYVLEVPYIATTINTKSIFCAFVNVNTTAYVNMKGHCYFVSDQGMGWQCRTFKATHFRASHHQGVPSSGPLMEVINLATHFLQQRSRHSSTAISIT